MDLVLGLSMTSQALRWVLVEGTTGEGNTVDRGAFDLATRVEPDELLDVALADRDDDYIHAVGVTWTNETEASEVLDALAARGFDNVIAVSELEAGEVLATGIADIAEYDDVAVCIVEPDAAVIAMVNANGAATDRVGRPADGNDVVELPSSVIATLELNDWQPDAVFVLGSADNLDLIASTLEDVAESPVISAADADLAMARGAALASARAVAGLQPPRRLPSKIGALSSIVAAAVVTFVVTLSAALGLSLTHHGGAGALEVASATESSAAQATTQAPAPVTAEPRSTNEARLVVARTIAVAVPPAPIAVPAPAYEPPAAPVAPPPAYVPPPPPAQVPLVPQPRLRDRIIERIPIINRFHEPKPQYPQ